MEFDFDKIVDRRGTHSKKWDFSERYTGRENLFPLSMSDMDFESPQPVIDALRKRIEHGIFGYSMISDSYYRAVVDWMKRRHNWTIRREWFLFTPGVVPALYQAVQSFTEPGDKVIVQPPTFYPFFQAVRYNGRELVNNQLKLENGRYSMDFEGLEEAIDSRTRMLILCNPQNPVGRVWTEAELLRLGRICVKHDIVIMSDEIHGDLVFKGHKHIPIATLSEEIADIVVTCTAPTKTFNFSDMQFANIIASNKILFDKLNDTILKGSRILPNGFAIEALEAAYNHGEQWLGQLLDYLEGNYQFLCSFMKEHLPAVKVMPLEGTYLAWVDFRSLGLDAREINHRLIHDAGVWLDEGGNFGEGGSGFQRINIGCPRKVLEKGLRKIAQVLNS